MESRVAGIIRWLERCVKSYRDGSVESALMDAECARADMENLRGDLWKKLERRALRAHRKRWAGSLKTAEALFCALAVILFMAAPLASPKDVPAAEEPAGMMTMEWLTPDEAELITNVRKRPDASLAMAAVPEIPAAMSVPEPVKERAPAPIRAAAPAAQVRPRPAPLPVERREQKVQETGLTYDSILSLIETGERAMKNEPPVVRVENVN